MTSAKRARFANVALMSHLRIYLRVIALLAPERGLTALLLLANLGLAGAFFLEPWLFGRVVDALAAATGTAAPRGGSWVWIWRWAMVGLAAMAAGTWVALHADRLAHRRRLAVIADFFEHAIALPLSYHAGHHSGRLLRILQSGSGNLFGLWLGFLREHLATLLSIFVMVPLALRMNWRLALLMIALLVVFAIGNALAVKHTSAAQAGVEELHAQLAERTGDVLGNVLVVQSFTRIAAEVASVRALGRRVLAAQYPVLRGWAWLSVANRSASTLTIVAIFALGSYLHGQGNASVGTIVSFVGFALALIGRLEQFSSFLSGLFFQAPGLAEFFSVLDTPPAIRASIGAPPLGPVRGEVAFENVSFSYGAGHPALHALSFKVPAGATVALVGPTGAGKTTALALLYRAHDPQAGRITIDGIDIRGVDLDSLRAAIAVVFQDPGLFYRTIADNLRVGKPDAAEAELEAAARAAQAHEFIVVKPKAYATLVAERGASLSGGERQRLSIARAMLKDAPILILDEATSALDNATEARIQQALSALTRGRTTFVIAHRLSTVRNAELILVLDHGRVVERGRYPELVRQGGLFAELERQGSFVADQEPGPGP
jgi:ATP-binding cassette subfamily B protein